MYLFAISFLVWIGVSSVIQAVKCPDLTQSQILLRVPDSFVCDWIDCR
jgi:hypothetical protein